MHACTNQLLASHLPHVCAMPGSQPGQRAADNGGSTSQHV